MAGPRLGVLFDEVIHPRRLGTDELPGPTERARAGALSWLIRKSGIYRLVVYPLVPAPDLHLAIQAWLFLQFLRYYEAHGMSDAVGHALGTMDAIDCVSIRPADLDYEFTRPDCWPTAGEMDGFRLEGASAAAPAT